MSECVSEWVGMYVGSQVLPVLAVLTVLAVSMCGWIRGWVRVLVYRQVHAQEPVNK